MKRILVVDDDTKIARALAIRLQAAGYESLTAINGLDAVDLVFTHKPDLIIMDIWMPQAMGILTAQRLKHFGLSDVPVIFLTASRKEDVWPILEEVQPAGFFEKPYNSKEILDSIHLLMADVKPSLVPNYEEDTHYRG